MITKEHFKDKVDIHYYLDNTKIINSYLLTDEEIPKIAEQIEFARHTKYDWKCLHIRRKDSYIREIKAHNKLFKYGLFKSHTIDTDLEENIDIIHKVIWWLIGR
jgi:hypothetical protein